MSLRRVTASNFLLLLLVESIRQKFHSALIFRVALDDIRKLDCTDGGNLTWLVIRFKPLNAKG